MSSLFQNRFLMSQILCTLLCTMHTLSAGINSVTLKYIRVVSSFSVTSAVMIKTVYKSVNPMIRVGVIIRLVG